jgi:hypothetical protein
MKNLFLLVCVFVLSGCADMAPAPYKGTYRFSGPGTFQEFAQVRYQCLQETKARVSSGFANEFGASAGSTVKPSCSAFAACLAAKGYYNDPNGNLDASSIIVDCNR